jgi:hypothetical protein
MIAIISSPSFLMVWSNEPLELSMLKFAVKVDHKHTWTLRMEWRLYVRITNMAMGINFRGTYKKFSGNKICRPTKARTFWKQECSHHHRRAQSFLRSRQLCSYSITSQHFMEPKSSLPCSQEPSTGLHPEPDRSSSYHPIPSRPISLKLYFNFVHPPTSWSS